MLTALLARGLYLKVPSTAISVKSVFWATTTTASGSTTVWELKTTTGSFFYFSVLNCTT